MTPLSGQLEDAATELAQFKKLSLTSTIGLAAGGIGLLSSIAGLFGESEHDRENRKIMQENVKALRELTKSLNDTRLGLTGNQYRQFAGISGQLAGASYGGITDLPRYLGQITGILASAGLTISDLQAFAKTLGITLDPEHLASFIAGLDKLDEALKQLALVRLKDFSGQLDLLNRTWAITGAGPIDRLADLVKLIQGAEGAQALGGALGGFNLATGGGRNAAREFLLEQLRRAQAGQLTTAELGGLTVTQYLDFLSQFGALLNEANQAIQGTIDNLQAFADSLKLDQGLTTLSPAQQLAEARRQYEDVLRAAQMGDQAAAGRLPDVARQFLTASRAYNASSPAYAADFARVTRETDELIQSLRGPWEQLQKPIGEVAENTESTVERLDTMIEVTRVGLQVLVDKVDDLRSEMAAQVLATKIGLEGGKV
jgi:hypothetical protein